jgi:hypothetical protein
LGSLYYLEGIAMTEEFNKWWNSDWLIDDNPYTQGTPAYWAWAGWQAALKVEREECAKVAFNARTYIEAAQAIRARGQV